MGIAASISFWSTFLFTSGLTPERGLLLGLIGSWLGGWAVVIAFVSDRRIQTILEGGVYEKIAVLYGYAADVRAIWPTKQQATKIEDYLTAKIVADVKAMDSIKGGLDDQPSRALRRPVMLCSRK